MQILQTLREDIQRRTQAADSLMVQETTTRRRSSSGSSSRHKKSQRVIIKPPKLPRLILHPPKPPKSQQARANMTLEPSNFFSPEFEAHPSGWKDTTLAGNGQDSSYEYDNICKVQAILRAFNGSTSATRKIEMAEHKCNGNEMLSRDVSVFRTDAAHDRARAELEMNDILQEALDCNHCEKTMRLKPENMLSDIRHGVYRSAEDPPFLLNQPHDDDVAPDEMPEIVDEPGHLHLATTAQQQQYLQIVDRFVARNRKRKVFRALEDAGQPFDESKFGYYCVDFHIHQHFIRRRSILNICRTDEEMDDVRFFKQRLAVWHAQKDSQLANTPAEPHDESYFYMTSASMTAPICVSQRQTYGTNATSRDDFLLDDASSRNSSIFSSTTNPSSPSTAASTPPKPSSFSNILAPAIIPWAVQQAEFANQISLHRHLTDPHARAARVRDTRERWRKIMEKRAEQRHDGLIIANYEAAFLFQNWQRGKGGPISIPRDEKITELLKLYRR